MLTYIDEGHKYYWDGLNVPGVNEILLASGISSFDHIPAHKREAGMHFGKVIHSVCELHDKDDLDLDWVIENDLNTEYKVRPYLKGWIKFVRESGCKIISIEQKLYSKKRGFAGRHDRVIILNSLYTLLDIKTYVDSKGGTDLQLAGYEILWNENYPAERIKNRVAVHLTPVDYQIIPYRNKSDRNDFLLALQMYNLRKKRGLIK